MDNSQRCEECWCKTAWIGWLTASACWAVTKLAPFCAAFKLVDEASSSKNSFVSRGGQLLPPQHGSSALAALLTAYCSACVQEFLTMYLCRLNSPPLTPIKDSKVTYELFGLLIFLKHTIAFTEITPEIWQHPLIFFCYVFRDGMLYAVCLKIRMSNNKGKCFPGDKETPAFGWNHRDTDTDLNRLWGYLETNPH